MQHLGRIVSTVAKWRETRSAKLVMSAMCCGAILYGISIIVWYDPQLDAVSKRAETSVVVVYGKTGISYYRVGESDTKYIVNEIGQRTTRMEFIQHSIMHRVGVHLFDRSNKHIGFIILRPSTFFARGARPVDDEIVSRISGLEKLEPPMSYSDDPECVIYRSYH